MTVAATEAVLATEAGDTGDLELSSLFFLGLFGVVGAMGGEMVGGGGMIEGAIALPLFQSCLVGAVVGNARSERTPGWYGRWYIP